MEATGALDLPGLSLPPAPDTERRRPSDAALRALIVPGVGGRRVFRILISESCRHECEACPMAAQRELGALAEPRRLARAFVAAWRRGWCDGVFVTAGVPKSATWAMEKLLETVETLRFTLGFRGYVHVKIPAGIDRRQLERMMALVDRVSFQLEPACIRAESIEHAEDPLNASDPAALEASATENPSQRSAAQAPARRRDTRTRKVETSVNSRGQFLGGQQLGGIGRRGSEVPRPRPASRRSLEPTLFDLRIPSANRP